MWLQREHFFCLLANIAVLINAYVSDYQNDVDEDYFSYNEDKKEDLHVIHLSRNNHPFYKFEAFGRDINLHLKPNENIVANGFKTYLFDGKNKIEVPYEPRSCFYLHKDNVTTAALNLCDKHKLHGFIFHKNYIFEINPADDIPTESNETSIPHYIKRSFVDEQPWNFDPGFYKYKPIEMQSLTRVKKNIIKRSISSGKRATIEAALFFDAAAYKIFAPYFNYDITQLRDMLLAYINGVQALYHHPSTGNAVDILLMRLEIFQEQPQDLQAYGGEREALLDSFCEYNQKYNPPGDSHPEHWDIGLYVSGLDFYAIEKGKKSGATMGLAVVGGICQTRYACVIAEFGVTNIFGKPYPSAGFTSVFVLAHEIGHSLGMHHDGYTNNCPKDGFIMSPSRGVYGETLWSTCSAEILTGLNTWASCLYDNPTVVKNLDHRKFDDAPGMVWNAKKQCEILLKDRDADTFIIGKDEEICKNIRCKTPHSAGFYFGGPAMEGTICGSKKWCQGGECVPISENRPNRVVVGGWSDWKSEPCNSGCLLDSKGYRARHRTCNNPKPVNTNEGCEGLSYEVQTCNDRKICQNKRRTTDNYASSKCQEFSKLIKDIDSLGLGLQAPHEHERPWMGCAIFCRRSDGISYYTPRVELNDVGVSPYFPDGTLCHTDGNTKFYCIQHHCLPENFQFNKNLWKDDIQLLQNAPPSLLPLPENLKRYLSIDINGNPLLKTLTLDSNYIPPEESWETKDYIEIPRN